MVGFRFGIGFFGMAIWIGIQTSFNTAGNRLPNPLPLGVHSNKFNYSYGWNRYGLNDDGRERSVKLGSVVLPSDCVVLGDTAGWSSVVNFGPSLIDFNLSDARFLNAHFHPPLFSPVPYSLDSRYTFHLTRRHYGNANVAFLDGQCGAWESSGLDFAGGVGSSPLALGWQGAFE